jgi:hypothetical protein
LNSITYLICFASAGLIASCVASIPPPAELNDARQAYARASVSPTVQLTPENLYKAREALVRAEKSYRDSPKSERTRDLANLAHREAKMAIELATTGSDSTITAKAKKDFQPATAETLRKQ